MATITTMTLAELLRVKHCKPPGLEQVSHKIVTTNPPKRSLCENSEYSERLAFQKLGFTWRNQIASETHLSTCYPNQKVPDAIFSTIDGNIAVEVKRVKNVMHKDTVVNAIGKMHAAIVNDFNIKQYHIVFQTRGNGARDKVTCVVRDVHGILKKMITTVPYRLQTGPTLFIHIQKVGETAFTNIGYN